MKFNAGSKIKQAVISYIIHHLASYDDLDDLELAFRQIDMNKNGGIDYDELVSVCLDVYGELFKKEEA
jgi:Ca2+-binding EF-hand superfamily protein